MTTIPPPAERQLALTLARNLLPTDRPAGADDVRRAVGGARAALEGPMGFSWDLDDDGLARELEALVTIFVGGSTSLADDADHVEWLSARRHEIDWRFWDRYRRWIGDVQGLPPQAVQRLDEITDDVLRRLEDPARTGAWDRRGMVVGQVQSGKTANYTGLICKAADAGYKLIVVLAGLHNSLRSQTQLRLDEGFLGFDTQQARMYDQTNRRMGVGRLPGVGLLAVNSMTNSEQKGDFNLGVARQVAMRIGSDPVLLVVKKNKSILTNLIKWVTTLHQEEHPETGRLVVPNISLLVIDDEADNASVNTRDRPLGDDGLPDPEINPTVINGLIRQLLHSFEKSAYIGYTATPFANIFIDEQAEQEPYGEDLFPRSFIIRLPEPTNYVGPAQVFGVRADATAGLEARAGLPIVREVDDSDGWIRQRHKRTEPVGPNIPDSLHEAIRAFLLSCAARTARGHSGQHHSMLVHVTQLVDIQEVVERQISAEVARLRDRLRYGDGDGNQTLLDELRLLWELDFEATTRAFADPALPLLRFEDVEPHLAAAAGRIETMRINGSVRDNLAYYDHPDGLTVIAVGGNKLSRGLTLEGLSVSYYLRATKMYDTLMQMGRWFGYRPGYTDLCRLYTTRELTDWYRDITVANEELLALFDEMAAVGGTPRDFGLRVRRHPDGLLITAPAKMRNGRVMQLSFENTTIETISFQRDVSIQRSNLELTGAFLDRQAAGHPIKERGGNHILTGVRGADLAAFMDSFVTHPGARKARGALLASYIRSRVADDLLDDWTVVLCGPSRAQKDPVPVGGIKINLTLRTIKTDPPPGDDVYVIRRIGSPGDEAIDLDAAELARAHARAVRLRPEFDPKTDTLAGPPIRYARPPRRGLLLLYALDPVGADYGDAPSLEAADAVIGFVVSFPCDDHAPGIEYAVTNVYWQQEFEF
ncbi:MAG: Z1 domain-containing protein [Solirubrobacteraceae bacterium]